MNHQPTPPPLGSYLTEHRGTMSKREAARRAGVSESRWRQVEAGYQSLGGHMLRVNPQPDTIVAMCTAVGADPRHGLRLAGFNPAQWEHFLPQTPPQAEDLDWFTNLSRADREAVLAHLTRLHLDAAIAQAG